MSYSVQQLIEETYSDELKELLDLEVYWKFDIDGWLTWIKDHEGSYCEKFGFDDDFGHAIERAKEAFAECDKCSSRSFDLNWDDELENRICNKCRGEWSDDVEIEIEL
jgi:Zn finger protein HypA/HybF involved in hydrogenase expression